MLGPHCIRHWNTTQITISLSSGEAELHGIAKGISHAIGMQSLCRDLGWSYKLRVHSDAVAAIGIARRRGLGKHIDEVCDAVNSLSSAKAGAGAVGFPESSTRRASKLWLPSTSVAGITGAS